MIQYPSIKHYKHMEDRTYFHVFPKLDGSNVRAEWTPKKGLHKFGKRNHLLGQGDALFPAVEAMQQHEDTLSEIASKNRWQRATFFFEWVGDQSFAGSHDPTDETLTVKLIDIHVYKRGFLPVTEYIKHTKHLDFACPYLGEFHTSRFIGPVRRGDFPGQSFEGVVAKRDSRKGRIQFKIKNRAWIDKLKEIHSTNWLKFV